MPDFKENINSWPPQGNEWKQDDQAYKDKLDKYATEISELLKKKDERFIGTFDIQSTLLNGSMDRSKYPKYNTANPGAIALIRFLKEQKKDKYESSIASITSAEYFDAYKLLDQDKFFKNDTAFSIYNKNNGFKSKNIEDIKSEILEKIDETQKEKMNLLLPLLNLGGHTPGALAKKYSVVFEALYRRFILDEKNINMLFFDNDIEYIDSTKKGITNFLDSKLVNSNYSEETVRSLLTELGITVTPICAASGHITFEKKAEVDGNQSRKQAVFLNDLAREVMKKQDLDQNEIDKKMLEAEKICFEEYVSRDKKNKLDGKDEEINKHIANLDKQIAEKQTLISAPPPPPPPATNNTIVVKKCQTSGSGLLCFMHAAFGEKKDNEYKCSDENIEQKTKELKDSIIADVNKAFTSDIEADKKRLIEEYTSLVTAEIEATSDENEKTLLQTSLDALNDISIIDNDKKETIINCIDKIKNTFPLIWFSNAAKINNNNIVLISKYNNDGNFHIDDQSVENPKNDIYIYFDGTGVGHFSRCEKIDYKKVLDADEINVSDIRLEQVTEEIYVKQRGIIDGMKEYDKEKIDKCIKKIRFGLDSHISDLKENHVIVDDDFVKKITTKKELELNALIAKKELIAKKVQSVAPTISVKGHISSLKENNMIVDKLITEKNLVLNELIDRKQQSFAPTIILNNKKNDEYQKKNFSSLINNKSISNDNKTNNIFFKTDLKKSYPAVKNNVGSQNNTNNKERYMSATEEEYRSTEEPNTLYTPVYAVNNYAPTKIGEKIMSSSVNNSFKTDQPIDKDISKDYSNPYIAKLKELQEKAQKIGIFSRITLAIFSWFSSSSAKKRSAIKKLKTISIKNQDEPSYKDDKEMYDLLKKCLDDNKSFVSDIPTLPLKNDIIYNNKMQATPLGAMHNSLEIFKERIINFINSVPNKSEDNKELAKIIFDSSEEFIDSANNLSIEISDGRLIPDDSLDKMNVLMKRICESTGRIISNNKNFKYDYKTESGLLFDSLKLLSVNTQNFVNFAFDGIGDPKLSQVKTQLGNINNRLEGIQKDIEGTLNNSHQLSYQQRASAESNNRQLGY